jgi:hypothetical protein
MTSDHFCAFMKALQAASGAKLPFEQTADSAKCFVALSSDGLPPLPCWRISAGCWAGALAAEGLAPTSRRAIAGIMSEGDSVLPSR